MHCAQYARSSGGRVHVGDLIRKVINDGATHATTALAAHGLTILSSGEVGILGIRADDIMLLDRAKLMEHWKPFPDPDALRDAVLDGENGIWLSL
eukprot:5703842-Pyramimonas_sp.AAC.1